MRYITLLNPEIAQKGFEHYKWLDESEYFIKAEGATSETLCSASFSCGNITAVRNYPSYYFGAFLSNTSDNIK